MLTVLEYFKSPVFFMKRLNKLASVPEYLLLVCVANALGRYAVDHEDFVIALLGET